MRAARPGAFGWSASTFVLELTSMAATIDERDAVARFLGALARLPREQRPTLNVRSWAAIALSAMAKQGLELNGVCVGPFGSVSLTFAPLGDARAALHVEPEGSIVAMVDDTSAPDGEWLWQVKRTSVGLQHMARAIRQRLGDADSQRDRPSGVRLALRPWACDDA